MEFAVHDINKDALEITVFDKDLFSPNGEFTFVILNWMTTTATINN